MYIGWYNIHSRNRHYTYKILQHSAKWFAAPTFVKPKFESQAISIIVPVCVVLLAENLGHIKAVGAMAEKPLDKYLGRAIVGDAVATIVSSSFGGPGTTTYSENIGVMVIFFIFLLLSRVLTNPLF
jgi:xanthine/uracil permease